MELYCTRCKEPTEHRQKLYNNVCNKCDNCNSNYPIYLERIHDRLSNIGTSLLWIEWDELGRGKAAHLDPQVGFSLCLDPESFQPDIPNLEGLPPIATYSWMTTEIIEIIEDSQSNRYRTIRFKTLNSEYYLHITKI